MCKSRSGCRSTPRPCRKDEAGISGRQELNGASPSVRSFDPEDFLFFEFSDQLLGNSQPLNIVRPFVCLYDLRVPQKTFHRIFSSNTVASMYHHSEQR